MSQEYKGIRKKAFTGVIRDNEDGLNCVSLNGAVSRFGRGRIHDLALLPNSVYLAVATTIGVWWYELSTMSLVALWETERGMLGTIAISHDGQWAVTGNGDGVIKVWDVPNGVCITRMRRESEQILGPLRTSGIKQLAFSPDRQYLAATGIRDDIVYTWKPETGTAHAQFYDTQREQRRRVLARPVVFSPDSRLLACAGASDNLDIGGIILVWDVVSGECVARLIGQIGFVNSLCFSPCGQYLVSGGYSGTVQVWNTNTWQQDNAPQQFDESHISVCYSQDGALYAVGISRDSAVVWDVEHREKRYTYREKRGYIQSALFSGDSHFIVAGAKTWTVWTPENTEPHKFSHLHLTSFPNTVAFSQDGKKIVSGTRSSVDNIRLWDIEKPLQRPRGIKQIGNAHAVSLSTSGQVYATSYEYDGNTVRVQNITENTQQTVFTHPESDAVITAASLSPIGDLLAGGDSKGRSYVWDTTSGAIRNMFTHTLENNENSGKIMSLTFSHDGKLLVSINANGSVAKLWDLKEEKKIQGFLGKGIHRMAFSPCGDVVACGRINEILLCSAPTYQTSKIIDSSQGVRQPFALCFSPCGRYLVSGEWWQEWRMKVPIRLWEVETGQNIHTFWGHPSDIQDLAFSPDGMLLASGSYDGTILLWNMKPYLINT